MTAEDALGGGRRSSSSMRRSSSWRRRSEPRGATGVAKIQIVLLITTTFF
eukprot:CAMPEP_0181062168 /NCGR_PEP_ID=MMETSP1070-20121207/22925_1 /TAXON_ID=265543 /ORGANISM="Minutocellus polymorphus, Strain NH13" /LENGTH=49 /DNA_ID= /DNA_START= /DNA_END= /DNA_ORIENTATION=